jgi:hypothetical protein
MATQTKTPAATKVITGRVRLSYVHLDRPYAQNEGQEPKYSCVILIPKSDKATMKKLRAAQQVALEQGKTSRFNGSIPKNWKDTIHDGDEEADLERNPEMEGHWTISVSSKTQPGCIDRQKEEILNVSEELYSGCYARVSLNAFPFNTQGNKGVSFGLNHVQKLADGEFLGGRSRAEDDFDDLEDDEDDEDLL